VNVEGGASRAEIIEPKRGVLAHTNHYTHPAMLDLEASDSIAGSVTRLRRAQALLGLQREPWTVHALLAVLSDHENAPNSLCRHGEDDLARTVFWCVADVTAGSIRYGSGPPCTSDPMLYQLPQMTGGEIAASRSRTGDRRSADA
jgi:isopenicillin-N N-acyltransferase-like protein